MTRTSQRGAFRVLVACVKPFYLVLARPRLEGLENIPSTGGFVMVSNHLTEIDPITVGYTVYRAGVMPRFLAKESLFKVPVMGPLIRKLGQVPVYRGTSRAKDSLEAAAKEINSGGVVILYPEGTLTRDPHMWPMRARSGAARLALQCNVPVVPLAHWGDQEILYRDPSGHRTWSLFPRKTVRVVVGKPIEPHELMVDPTQPIATAGPADYAHGTRVFMSRLTEQLAYLRGEPAPDNVFDPSTPGAQS